MVDTVQPQGLLRFRNRSASSPLIEDAAAEMEQTQNRGTTPTKRLPQWEGAGCRRNLPAFRSREKYFL